MLAELDLIQLSLTNKPTSLEALHVLACSARWRSPNIVEGLGRVWARGYD